MFVHRENALKAHQHTCISYCSILVNLKKKFNTKSDQSIHQDVSNCTFKNNFLQGSMPPSMCAADIIISVWKRTFFYSECNRNIH